MIQDIIHFNGINRAVPQTTAEDGSCQEIINLRPRKGCWRPIGNKTLERSANFTFNGSPITFDKIYLHDIDNGLVASKPNWIGYKKAFETPAWTSEQTFARAVALGYQGLTLNEYLNDLSEFDTNAADGTNTYFCYLFQLNIGYEGTYDQWLDMEVIFGPSLYLIAQDNTCTLIDVLPNETFDTKVVFLKQTMLVTTGEGVYVYIYNRETGYVRTKNLPVPEIKMEKINKVMYSQSPTVATAEGVLGEYFNALNTHSQNEGAMFGSIMYIVCYRLFDGSYIFPSVPKYFEISNTFLFNGVDLFWCIFNLYGLKATIDCSVYTEEMAVFKDVIDSICIFSTKATPLFQIDTSTLTQETLERNFTDNVNWEGYVNVKKPDLPVSKEFKDLAKSAGWYKIGEFSFEEVVGVAGREAKELDTKGFYQDYATRESLDTDQLSHHQIVAKTAYVYNDRLHLANIKTLFGNPYVQWVQDQGTKKEYDGYITVWLKTGLGQVKVQSSVKVPCYRKREKQFQDFEMPEGTLSSEYLSFLQTVTQRPLYVYGSIYAEEVLRYQVGNERWRIYWEEYTVPEEYEFWIPSVIGYNDARAYKMEIGVINNTDYVNLLSVSLKKNAEMNFAYYHAELFNKDETDILSNFPIFIKPESGMAPSSFVAGGVGTGYDMNRMQVSEVQNPLIFPARLSYQVGTGAIIGIMAGSEPLSTGQFGQFPLQIFTSKGIWAMEIGTGDVLYTNILPVNGEVANNADNLQAIGAGVVYTTDRGLSIVQGRQTMQLSEVLEGLPYTQITGKEEITTLTGTDIMFTSGLSGALSDIDFLQYLQHSTVGYDHMNAELIVTNSSKGYSYLYGFESKTWYKINKSFSLLINNYPQLLGIDGPEVLNLSKEAETGTVKTLIVSNSCSFKHINVHKRIIRAVMRCKFSTGLGRYGSFHVLGSDDLQTYQYLTGRQSTGTNVKDLLIQRSHGSSKFYVIIWNGEVSINSEMIHIDLIFKTKWNNRLR